MTEARKKSLELIARMLPTDLSKGSHKTDEKELATISASWR